jgi:hypothetical protein
MIRTLKVTVRADHHEETQFSHSSSIRLSRPVAYGSIIHYRSRQMMRGDNTRRQRL